VEYFKIYVTIQIFRKINIICNYQPVTNTYTSVVYDPVHHLLPEWTEKNGGKP
jgi:hypothetical protein